MSPGNETTLDEPILSARNLSLSFGDVRALDEVSVDLWPGEVLAIVGESGSGKSTLLRVLAGEARPDAGAVAYRDTAGAVLDVHHMGEPGLRMGVSAGGNVGERLMAVGARHYGDIRAEASHWLERVEISPTRIDDRPGLFSGGMRQRLQIARTLVTRPRLVFMDEPTGGLDVSVQARLLDLIRGLVSDLGIAVVLVTHDIAAARLLAHRLVVMRHGRVVEEGLTDRVLDDPRHPYTQLLVSSVLAA
jgi:putative phosphonate transport system ATP-binding protein